MNWRRGFFRIWVVVSAAWIGVTGAWFAVTFQTPRDLSPIIVILDNRVFTYPRIMGQKGIQKALRKEVGNINNIRKSKRRKCARRDNDEDTKMQCAMEDLKPITEIPEDWIDQFKSHKESTLSIILIDLVYILMPPFILLLLGLSIYWTLKGFKS